MEQPTNIEIGQYELVQIADSTGNVPYEAPVYSVCVITQDKKIVLLELCDEFNGHYVPNSNRRFNADYNKLKRFYN